MIYPIETITPPAEEPVTLAKAKLHLRVDIADDNDLISSHITAARIALEGHLGRRLITQTVEQYEDGWPTICQKLRLCPVQSITSIKWINESGTETAVTSSDYYIGPGNKVWLKSGSTWPTTTDLRAGGIAYRYIAGYGDDGDAVPAPIKAAILLLVGDLYENREATVTGGARISPLITFGVENLVANYRAHFGT